MACVEKVKSQHFQTIGRNIKGKEWLLPEEMLFLLERGTLDVRWPVKDGNTGELGIPMSLQGAYAACIGMEEGVGGKLTLEMFNVYAGLRRAGYVVFRTGSWEDERADLQPPSTLPQISRVGENGWALGFFKELWRRVFQKEISVPPERLRFGPLVGPGLYRSYADIYRLLKIIPSRDLSSPPVFMLPPDRDNPFRVTFDIWKTTTKFRKSKRPPPDYRIVVINAREQNIPTHAQLNDLLVTVPDDPPKEGQQLYQKLKQGKRNVILAIVDQGIPSYIRVSDACFIDAPLYERLGKGPRGKGGGRGRGRGRGGRGGRGRGRGG